MTLATTPNKTLCQRFPPMPRIGSDQTAPTTNGPPYWPVAACVAAGKKTQAQEIAAEIARLWPDDPAARIRQFIATAARRIRMAQRKQRSAKRRCFGKGPQNWQARQRSGSRSSSRAEAGSTGRIRGPGHRRRTAGCASAVRAAILAVRTLRRRRPHDARILGAKPLLPEERALNRPLLQ